MKNIDAIEIVKDLSSMGERQAKIAEKAATYICAVLKAAGITYSVEWFSTYIPKITRAKLFVDGITISCEGCSFVDGKISGKESLVSSLISSQPLIEKSNINFNPACDTISRSNFYFAPALAVRKNDMNAILNGKKIEGNVRVRKVKVRAAHILVGNKKNPKIIVFAHYDSIGPGAIDNASGVATTLAAIAENPESIKNTLYVFDGNEELSYDFPVYWGHGFRVFEKKYFKEMDGAKKIIAVDCVGNGKTIPIRDLRIIKLAFPIKNIERWENKILTLGADIEKLMTVYHSASDLPSELNPKDLRQARKTLTLLIR